MGVKEMLVSAGASAIFSKVTGGLDTSVATEHVGAFLKKSGGVVEKVARFVGLLPKEEKGLAYLKEQSDPLGLTDDINTILSQDPVIFGTLWEQINDANWEEFCVRGDDNLDMSSMQHIIDAAKENADLERGIQAVAEAKFPQLYLLRCIGLGLTATDENWAMRVKVNTFRTFFLRLALPGTKYDKFINYYVILTSSKDAWDELRAGQNAKTGFAIDLASNVAGVKIGEFFEEKFSKLVKDKWEEYSSPEKLTE